MNYWWISVNPRVFRFKDFDIGDSFTISSLKDDGSERKIQKNFMEAKEKEIVIVYENKSMTEGQIVGLCEIEKELNNNEIRLKKIENLTESIPKIVLENIRDIGNIEPFRFQDAMFFKLSETEYKSIYSLLREMNPEKSYMTYEDYSKEDFLKEVFFDSDDYDDLKDLILTRKNVVLEGAPGIGKTYIAKKMAFSIIGKKDTDKILNIEFHPNYSVDEFIEGYRPDSIGIYKYHEGSFKQFCNCARNDKSHKYFLLIDEINRGDIIKIFGDTFMLLELDKRGKENYVELPASGERFYIPENLYIIGTMNYSEENNPFEDFAVRRRFCFYKIEDIFENKNFIKKIQESKLKMQLAEAVKDINKTLDDNKKIGHYYLLKDNNDADVLKTIKYELIPLVRECLKSNSEAQKRAVELLNSIK